ncbi:protein DpdG [Aliterella atlantica]|uniref:Uncharacterized protein n=1 Tax=Aliterella atlantica CENA595 TaxID=1618023 RepID=A0A0D8ZZ53_9CYAN|nr:protein DpdG [Aliterella atlantica]KJH72501.1 hypothetical protein UH38_07010 [Aliterella atlantica CENA595]
MSVLKEPFAIPSRFRGIYRYLLHAKGQREKREVLAKIISPDELVKDKPSPRPMFDASLRECFKCGLLIKEENEDYTEIVINPNLSAEARNPKTGDELLPNTLADLFFASDNEDEYDFGLVCAWYLSQNVYDPPRTWEAVEQKVAEQKVGELLKMTNNTLYGQMDDWMGYMGLLWGHALERKRILVPDPTIYLKRNLRYLFQKSDEKVLAREFIDRLAKKCPIFETGHFRETIEANIGRRQPNYLSNSTAFALLRLQNEGYIELKRESDADLMILPKANNQIDDSSRISHITYKG